MVRTLRGRLALTLVLVMLGATACGDDGDDGDGGEAQAGEELTTINLGVLPLADHAPLFYGIEQGFFADEGLDVQTQQGQGGAAMTSSVMEDELQFATGNYISLMLARQENIGIQVVSGLANGSATPDGGTQALLVKEDSGISEVEDLAGKTFGVNALANIAELVVRATLDDHGVDASGVQFRELDWPALNEAALEGEVDVVVQAEPFVTFGKDAGLVSLLDPMYETMPALPLGMVFASESWLDENPDLAAAFDRALQRSLEATSDEDAMRETMKATTEIPPEVVDTLPLPNWGSEIDRSEVALLGELAARHGILDEEPDVDELIWTDRS